jgi:hypothetical protein
VLSIFFLIISENLNLHQEVKYGAISSLRKACSRKFPDIKTIPTSETEIKSISHSLKFKNSSGHDDGITSKIVKFCASLTSHPLTQICNHSLFTGIFPGCLKISGIKQLYRKWDRTTVQLQAKLTVDYFL